MSQLYLKGVYYDAGDAGGLWFKNDSGSYEEVSAGGVTIYTGDGSLSGDRRVELDGHILIIRNGSDDDAYLILKPTVDAEQASLIATNHTGDDLSTGFAALAGEDFGSTTVGPSITTAGGNVSYLTNTVTPTDLTFELELSFNDGAKEASISGTLNSTTSAFSYTADTHTFNVGITITELAGVGTRAIAVDANGKIVLL